MICGFSRLVSILQRPKAGGDEARTRTFLQRLSLLTFEFNSRANTEALLSRSLEREGRALTKSERIIETLCAMDRVRIVTSVPGVRLARAESAQRLCLRLAVLIITEEFALLFHESPTTI